MVERESTLGGESERVYGRESEEGGLREQTVDLERAHQFSRAESVRFRVEYYRILHFLSLLNYFTHGTPYWVTRPVIRLIPTTRDMFIGRFSFTGAR